MSENTNNEKEIKATPSKDEAIIPVEKTEELKKEVKEAKKVEKVLDSVEEIEPVVEEVKAVITTPESSPKPGLGFVGNGAMGVTTFKEEKKPVVEKKAKKEDTVAIYSSRNVTWAEVGKVYIGYNIVSKAASEKWLTRDHTRLATPEEVAQEFGK